MKVQQVSFVQDFIYWLEIQSHWDGSLIFRSFTRVKKKISPLFYSFSLQPSLADIWVTMHIHLNSCTPNFQLSACCQQCLQKGWTWTPELTYLAKLYVFSPPSTVQIHWNQIRCDHFLFYPTSPFIIHPCWQWGCGFMIFLGLLPLHWPMTCRGTSGKSHLTNQWDGASLFSAFSLNVACVSLSIESAVEKEPLIAR